MLPWISVALSHCFPGFASKLINLEVLDLSGNDFSQAGDIFSSLRGLSSLKSLILIRCELTSTSISSNTIIFIFIFCSLTNTLNLIIANNFLYWTGRFVTITLVGDPWLIWKLFEHKFSQRLVLNFVFQKIKNKKNSNVLKRNIHIQFKLTFSSINLLQ